MGGSSNGGSMARLSTHPDDNSTRKIFTIKALHTPYPHCLSDWF